MDLVLVTVTESECEVGGAGLVDDDVGTRDVDADVVVGMETRGTGAGCTEDGCGMAAAGVEQRTGSFFGDTTDLLGDLLCSDCK